ncbi:DUF1800 domain-containing protein [Pseudoduganella namucuonensis]|uniref:Uncharacterized conserved protein, DUF1800 family n=1 Tax=Pseudoduganella namucuonensis TaxID=1035707 RepID=A0A1I7HP04_9BURK|nr:DUF1800 domain-containing protein [Pseudoduganella namucuonensis]SFU62452.1 Uncharacterized conserved protein, DUF1800 family [Pseudoduganella namucuonensis]
MLRITFATSLTLLLAACGGDGADSPSTQAPPPPAVKRLLAGGTTAASAMTSAQASRFLAQATFGPNAEGIADVAASGPAAWIDTQFKLPQTLHRTMYEQLAATLPSGEKAGAGEFYASFWHQAMRGEDQLRQRVTFALSQIFVVSMQDGTVANYPRGVATYYDTLATHAFGNYRELLEAVALHPMMGLYLSHLRNRKETGTQVPDENFAREVMQLFTIGLYELNPDGSRRTANGRYIDTYGRDDVAGLAKVFTGWSWGGPDKIGHRFYGAMPDPNRDWLPMQNYPDMHSSSDKQFLGQRVAGGGSGEADLKVALDTLFKHPNVGPFFGRQLIQRLVKSNPSPAYIARVSAAFADNGSGVRGDMRAVIRAVLLDPEARDAAIPAYKLREPVLRLANWLRAFDARSASGRYRVGNLDDPLEGIGQSPMRAPSVFNYYRPGYAPPRTEIAYSGLVAPEMQIAGEPSVTGYLNFMQTAIQFGIGSGRDITANYSAAAALASQPAKLVEHVGLLMLNGTMSQRLRKRMLAAVESVPQPAPTGYNDGAVENGKNSRVYAAVFLAMASPEYIVQR